MCKVYTGYHGTSDTSMFMCLYGQSSQAPKLLFFWKNKAGQDKRGESLAVISFYLPKLVTYFSNLQSCT